MAGFSSSHYVVRTPTLPIFWMWFYMRWPPSLIIFPHKTARVSDPYELYAFILPTLSPMKIGFLFPKTPLKVLDLVSLALLAGLQIHVHHHGQNGTVLWLPRTESHATLETRSDSAPPNHSNKDWGSVTLHGKSGRWSPQEGETNLAN